VAALLAAAYVQGLLATAVRVARHVRPSGLQQVTAPPAAAAVPASDSSDGGISTFYAAPSAVGFAQAMFAMRDDMPVTWVLTGSSTTWSA